MWKGYQRALPVPSMKRGERRWLSIQKKTIFFLIHILIFNVFYWLLVLFGFKHCELKEYCVLKCRATLLIVIERHICIEWGTSGIDIYFAVTV